MCCAGFLGNFHEVAEGIEVNLNGSRNTFRNAEAAFQALKFWDHADEFTKETGGGAFRKKRKLAGKEDFTYGGTGSNWQGMLLILRTKFAPGTRMARGLLTTADSFLLEHNAVTGRDSVWSDNSDGEGTNWLGIQLMIIRDELLKQMRWTAYISRVIDLETGEPLNEAAAAQWQDTVRAARNAVVEKVLEKRRKQQQEDLEALARQADERAIVAAQEAPRDHTAVGDVGEEPEDKDCMYYWDEFYDAAAATPSRCRRAFKYSDAKWEQLKEFLADWDPLQDMIEGIMYWHEARMMKHELWRVAWDEGRVAVPPPNLFRSCLLRVGVSEASIPRCLQGPPRPPGSKHVGDPRLEIQDVYFSATEVEQVFRKRRPGRTSLLKMLMSAFGGDAPMGFVVLVWLCTAVFAVTAYFLFALLIFSVPADFAVESGVLAASSTGDDVAPPLATGALTRFRTLGDYPWLGLSELRMAEDVVLQDFDGARHMLRIAHVARNASGFVFVKGVDGSDIRVDISGRIFWKRPGARNEARLVETERWPSKYTRNTNPELSVSGAFAEHVVL
jgi:predicted NAD-dependent protein-ADP-ribosyltransferase YbiA (DUF1768 family)